MGRGRQALHQKVLLHFAFTFYIVQFKIILFRGQFLQELNLLTLKASMVHVVLLIPHTALDPFCKILDWLHYQQTFIEADICRTIEMSEINCKNNRTKPLA